MAAPTLRNDRRAGAGNPDAWYRQSIVWLAAGVLVASIAGCVWLFIVGQRYADPPLPLAGPQILKMPLARPPAPEADPPS